MPGERTAREDRKEELDALREIIDIAHETEEEINDTSDQDDKPQGALTFYLPSQLLEHRVHFILSFKTCGAYLINYRV